MTTTDIIPGARVWTPQGLATVKHVASKRSSLHGSALVVLDQPARLDGALRKEVPVQLTDLRPLADNVVSFADWKARRAA